MAELLRNGRSVLVGPGHRVRRRRLARPDHRDVAAGARVAQGHHDGRAGDPGDHLGAPHRAVVRIRMEGSRLDGGSDGDPTRGGERRSGRRGDPTRPGPDVEGLWSAAAATRARPGAALRHGLRVHRGAVRDHRGLERRPAVRVVRVHQGRRVAHPILVRREQLRRLRGMGRALRRLHRRLGSARAGPDPKARVPLADHGREALRNSKEVHVAVLKVENLSKVFPAANKGSEPTSALERIDLELGGHVFVSLVGPSGCGKSTFLNILSGVEEPSSGRITVTGDDGSPARFGNVFQDPRLLPWRTIMQNILYVHDDRGAETRRRALEYLDMVGLAQTADMYRAQLSGGMQQRAGIARAFSVDPDLLLMDEPFSHLDAITARSLRDQLQDIWSRTRKTVLFVTHDVTEAVLLSEKIIVMTHGGRIHAEFTIDLPHPRKASDPEVAALQAEILGEFEKIQARAGDGGDGNAAGRSDESRGTVADPLAQGS